MVRFLEKKHGSIVNFTSNLKTIDMVFCFNINLNIIFLFSLKIYQLIKLL